MTSITELEFTLLDGKYNEDDYNVLFKIVITAPKTYTIYAWDGLEWRSDEKAVNRVYTDKNAQHEYDDFVQRLTILRKNNLLYERALDLNEDEVFYFNKERIYLYIDSKK